MSAPRSKSKPVAAHEDSGRAAPCNHNAVTVLEPLATRQKCQCIKGPRRTEKREARRIEDQFLRRRAARCLSEKVSPGCVTDRRVKIVPIERYRLSSIEAVDYLAGAHPILFCFAEVIAE
jgi:hypothetical protein